MDTPFGEFMQLGASPQVPTLVRLHERPWGAVAALPSAKLGEAGFQGERGNPSVCVRAHSRVHAPRVCLLGPHPASA